jgi:hypothetical protein
MWVKGEEHHGIYSYTPICMHWNPQWYNIVHIVIRICYVCLETRSTPYLKTFSCFVSRSVITLISYGSHMKIICSTRTKDHRRSSSFDWYNFFLLNICTIFIFTRMESWMCHSVDVHSLPTFDHRYIAIIFANLKSLAWRSNEGYEHHPLRLCNMKSSIGIGTSKSFYKEHRVFCHWS